ncbi:hypothetical protein GNP82_18500 [Aliivibrio fischeri]|uniref:hypothetical protein n=1 Tax=Aliivibrio fischeri TaxID=668 RepID=UPI0012D9FABD|nr:hypothetical protein [Aliivibrio fischeri]MUJ26323.1 hypothetical protein [Aliivibrio fischeri]MUK39530.1 hypothetical protein [Aliivibrio fischeri]MUL07570.1 hypothetical protein [Aliivibrio fischeri]
MEIKIPDEIIQTIVDFLVGSPKVLAALILSWVSGHTWSYIVFTYFREKNKSVGFFDSWMGKTALGLLWFSLIMLPIYFLVHDSYTIEYDKVLEILFSTILYSYVVQAIIFIAITIFKRG